MNYYNYKLIIVKEKKQCLICYEDYNKIINTNCNHNYCVSCYNNWFIDKNKDRCPYCRNYIFNNNYGNNYDSNYNIKNNINILNFVTNGLNYIV